MRTFPVTWRTGLVAFAWLTVASGGSALAQAVQPIQPITLSTTPSISPEVSAVVSALKSARPFRLNALSRHEAADRFQISGRKSDSVLNGALIGAGVAIAGGLFLCTRTEPWENCRDDVGPIVRIGAIGAGVGIAVDALIRSQRTPFDPGREATRVRAVPIVGRGTRGAVVSVGF